MTKNAFCSLPFTEIFLGPDGAIKTCCSATGFLGNLHTQTIDEILQGPKAKEVRKFILEDEWHPQCIQCKQQEEQGARSERSSDRDLSEFGALTEDSFILKRIDLRWSNTCNLACIYCYEYFSSKWADIKGIKVNTIKQQNEDSLFNFIENSIKQSPLDHSIIMLGGEPLLQKQNYRLITTLKGHGFYILSNLSVPLQTNKIAQLLLQEKNCHWGVSFETVGDRYEYVRHGASWSTFVENIDYFNGKVSHEQYRLEAHALYSIYSAFNLVEFYEFVIEKKFKNIYWNLLESSGNDTNVNILNLSDDLKLKAIDEIEKCEKLFPDGPGIHLLTNIKESLKAKETSYTNDTVILKDVEDLENKLSKSLKFKDLWPDLYRGLSC